MRLRARAKALVAAGEAVALVRVTGVKGSAPREVGAEMLVTGQGIAGSIGGGTLEWHALAEAQRMLAKGPSHLVSHHVLGPDLGQCCGGQVELHTQIYDRGNISSLQTGETLARHVLVFGAGHVGKALILALAQTEFNVTWIDPRAQAFPAAVPGRVTLFGGDNPAAALANAPPGALAYVMTHSHALDLAIVAECLKSPAIAATGLIGSVTKRARFERRLRDAGIAEDRIAALICPIGISGIRSKKPEAIAIATAAQILALDEQLVGLNAFAPLRQAHA